MKTCVLIKQVPDKDSILKISENNQSLIQDNITWVTNESDNYALEEALLLKEAHGGEVVVCTLGTESARQVLKDAMAKGADRSIFISDNQFESLDILTLSKIFSETLKNENFDIIFSGLQSDDIGNSQLGLLLSELLNMSHASLVMETEKNSETSIKVKRELENGWFQWTTLKLPASISIQSGINKPRYATLKGIMMVKNKPVKELNSQSFQNINLENKLKIKKMYIPEKTKETVFLEGNPNEIAEKITDILKNEIKVMR